MRIERDQAVTLLIVLLFVAAAVVGGWLPRRLQEQRLRDQIDTLKSQLGQESSNTPELGKLSRNVGDLRKAVHESSRFVPRDPDLADLLRSLSATLADLKVTDQEIQTQPIVAGAEYSVIPITLRFRGPFPAAYGFLRRVETMRRMVRVTRFDVAGSAEHPDDPPSVRVELCGFYAPGETGEAR
jgi:Tfp pilus assembly protein PilO